MYKHFDENMMNSDENKKLRLKFKIKSPTATTIDNDISAICRRPGAHYTITKFSTIGNLGHRRMNFDTYIYRTKHKHSTRVASNG